MSNAPQSEEAEDILERLFRSGRTNALLSWLFVGVLALVFVESALDFDRQWIAFVAVAGVIVLVPPIAHGDWRVMLPWELLALALLPILVRGLSGGELGLFAYYLSVAGLALVVTVELHMFTSLSVTHWFAVVFVVMTTLASVAAWSIVRWNFDRTFGTSYLSTNEALMTEFVWVTLAGFAAGVLFDAYFRRRDRQLWRAINWMIRR
ncbi:hypothetical protein [Halorussus salinisoli]|uniref:hypothetical protein n=1 Tax=Halorussus salinisoli TaxID=2558242 RepID=UPI0010C23F44|nr:hypothetical protein [Halorussus salinisoli]